MKTTLSRTSLAAACLCWVVARPLPAAMVDTVLSSGLNEPHSVLVAENDILYISDGANHRIVKYDVSGGLFVNLAGLPGVAGTNNGTGVQARFFQPQGLIFARGGLVVADSGNHLIRFVSFNGAVSNLAGVPLTPGHVNGARTVARFRYPLGLAADAAGNIYVADSQNNAIRKIDLANTVSTVVATNLVQPTTIVVPGLYQPGGVAVTDDGFLWIANSRNHTIHRVDLNTGAHELLAGVPGVAGTNDSLIATEALLNMPKGLYWSPGSTNLLICDSGSHSIRRLFFNGELGVWSLTTYAGVPGVAGAVNGDSRSATFNSPSGIAFDLMNRSYLVADRANHLIRRIQEGAPLPPIEKPQIGVVRFQPDEAGVLRSVLVPVTSQVFYNDEIIAMTSEGETQTYFTGGPTPPDPLLDPIPNPGPATVTTSPYFSGTAWRYSDGVPVSDFYAAYNAVPAADKISMRPDFTLKALGAAPGRRSSDVAKARFIFQVAKPAIYGDNAADFIVQNTTEGAEMWYTIDGTDPTNQPPALRLTALHPENFPPPITNAIMFKIQGYKANYLPSAVVSNVFHPSNYVPNRITFGFESGEASCDFLAAVGQQFFAPVTLSLLENQQAYTLQFALDVTNLHGPLIRSRELGFDSMLMKPIVGKTDIYEPIPPLLSLGGIQTAMLTNVDTITEMAYTLAGLSYFETLRTTHIYGPQGPFTNYATRESTVYTVPLTPYTNSYINEYSYLGLYDFGLTNLIATNYAAAHLSVGWLERAGQRVLYNTLEQDLIQYSQPRNRIFDARADRQVVLGAFSFGIPTTAPAGSLYRIEISRPSATTDGVYRPMELLTWTNGSFTNGPINSIKHVRVSSGSRPYLVGDAEPFRWVNAGEFGDTNLVNADVMQVFQTAVYHLNSPPPRSDLFDALDASNGTTNGLLNPGPGYDYLMNTIPFGDGLLNVDDVYVTFRRSLDPSLKWFVRYWTNGVRAAAEVPNRAPGQSSARKAVAKDSIPGAGPSAVQFVAEDSTLTGGGRVVQVPVRAHISGSRPIVVLMLSLTVEPLDGSPALTTPIQFSPVSGLGAPAVSASAGPNNYAAAWLNAGAPGVFGTNLVGYLTVTLPDAALPTAAYRVHFDHASASPNGLGLLPVQTVAGLLTLSDRSASSWGDGIPDAWRLKHFGTLGNLLSAAGADADGDNADNWAEYRAGTDPQNVRSRLHLLSSLVRTNLTRGIRLHWPTVTNRRYVLECTTSLGSGPWLPIATNLLGDGSPREYLDTNPAAPLRFYRVRVAE